MMKCQNQNKQNKKKIQKQLFTFNVNGWPGWRVCSVKTDNNWGASSKDEYESNISWDRFMLTIKTKLN